MTGLKHRWVVALGVLSLLTLAACADDGAEEGSATNAASATTTSLPQLDTLRFAVSNDEGNLSPFVYGTGYPGYYMMTLIFDTLLWPNPDNEPQPWLATDVERSDDFLTWTITLASGVSFHDGEPLTSADVKFTYEYFQQHNRGIFTSAVQPITSIETPDDQTIVLTLSSPAVGFEDQPLAYVPILPEHIWSTIDAPDDYTEEFMVGSGPYRMAEYVREEVYRFEAYPDYFRGAPIVDEIVMPIFAGPQAAFTALQAGEVDAVGPTLTPELKAQFNQGDLVTKGGPGFRGWYLYMNTGRAPFDQVEFRQAIAAAVDSDDIVDTLLLEEGITGSPGWVHASAPWSNPATLEHTTDLDRANSLLDGLGFADSDGDGVRENAAGDDLSFDFLVRGDDPIAPRAAELISEDLAAVGIDLNVAASESAGQRIWGDEPVGQFSGDYFIALHSWAGTVQLSPSWLVNMFHSDPTRGTLNRAAYENPAYDELAEMSAVTPDPDELEPILYEMQEILADDVPSLPIYFADEIYPYRPSVFDRWVHHTGYGILNKTAFLP